MLKTYRAAKFLVTGPLLLGLMTVINLMTSPGYLWVKWAALGIGIAWLVSLVRVLRALLLAGGLAALMMATRRRPRLGVSGRQSQKPQACASRRYSQSARPDSHCF